MSTQSNKTLVLYIGIALGVLVAAAAASVCLCRKDACAGSEDDLPKVLEDAHRTVQRLSEAIEALKAS